MSYAHLLRCKRIGPFDGKTSFPHLRRIGGRDTSELCSHVVNDVQIAVWALVTAYPEIRAHRLSIRRVHLNETREAQKTIERVVSL